jgi:hypothetical protein
MFWMYEGYRERSFDVLRRRRAPIGSAFAVLPARWDAGQT